METLRIGGRRYSDPDVISLCQQTGALIVLENARVLSIVGPSGQGAEYYAILEIAAGEDTNVAGEIANYRLFLRNE